MSEPAKKLEHVEADVSAQRVARVYAESLLNIGWQLMCGQEMLDDLDSVVNSVFPADAHLEEFLSSRIIEAERKATIIQKVFGGRAHDKFVDFLQILNQHGRLDLLRPILAEYRKAYDQRQNHARVLVTSAVPLDDDLKNKLLASLSEGMHRKPILETKIDPDIIGGLIVRVDDYQYDASISTRLNALRDQLIERGSHEIKSGRDRFSSSERN